MKQIRLLPIVIVAALALLLLKGIGIVTQGGYVLSGSTVAVAAGGGAEAGSEHPAEPVMSLPGAPTIKDSAPTLDDGVPTIPGLGAQTDDDHSGGSTEAGHGEAAEATAAGATGGAATAAPDDHAAGAPAIACPPAAGSAELEPDCLHTAGVNANGDAIPLVKDDAGGFVPLEPEDGPRSEAAILDRLSERRNELDQRETELDMRAALIEAAEKRIEERTAALAALETRINAMVDEKRTLEEAQFVSIVSMYELMKAKDAAAIFDQLDMQVLLRVARAMNPRKMAPILAKMNPLKAKEATAGMAIDRVEPTIELAGDDLGALPRIIGQ